MFDLTLFWDRCALGLWAVVLLFFACGVVSFYIKSGKYKVLRPSYIWIIGTLISVTYIVWPVFYKGNGWHTLLISLHHAWRAFLLDGSISEIVVKMATLYKVPFSTFAHFSYTFLGSVLYVAAPMFTAGFILSFFKNFIAYTRYLLSFGKEIHIFSELNEKTLALAKSIGDGNRSVQVIFADIIDKSEEKHLDLVDGAEELNAIFFRKDLDFISLSKRKNHKIYLINDDENEKIRHAQKVITNKKLVNNKDNTLYIFSDSDQCKVFLDSFTKTMQNEIRMQIECVNDIRFLIYHYLDKNGIQLFETADGGEISVAIVGFGRYGLELLKALLWYCQLPGFKINITVFEKDSNAKSKIGAMFPEIKIEENNTADGDMKYYLKVVDGVEVGSAQFKEEFLKYCGKFKNVFVALGTDAENVSASKTIRRYLAQQNISDIRISTVIYNTPLCKNVNGNIEGFEKIGDKKSKTEELEIFAFGDIESFYSKDTVIDNTFIDEGKEIHMRWEPEQEAKDQYNTYYMDDYNFYSSLAKALHYRLRGKLLGMPNKADIFPMLFDGDKNPLNYIIENTTGLDKVKELSEAFGILSKPFKKAEENTSVSEIFAKHTNKTYEDAVNAVKDTTKDTTEEADRIKAEALKKAKEMGIKNMSDYLAIGKAAADIDHIRWNAYMRTEGFVFGEKNVSLRRHGNLVSVQDLPFLKSADDI